MTCSHPVARAQDIIDRLKHLTKPVGEAEAKNLPSVWNELEDLLIMLATASKPSLDAQRKSDKLDAIIAVINRHMEMETRDGASNPNERTRSVSEHRRSRDSDSARHERRTSKAWDQRS